MLLSWSDQTGIAQALHQAYPEADRLSLSMHDLEKLIEGLSSPPLEKPPSEEHLRAVLWTWMRIASAGEEAA